MSADDLSPVDFDPFADGELSDAAPATAAQTEIWVAAQLGDDTTLAYNESITVELRGALDERALSRALAILPERHEALRTTFSRDGKSVCIARSLEVPIERVDLSTLAPAERDARLAELVRKEATTAFDLERGPLFRVALVRLDEADHRLILGSHHIVCDGWSFAVLLKDLGPLYGAAKASPSADSATLISRSGIGPAHAFTTYAREEAARDATREVEYWQGRFSTIPDPLDLPTDLPRPALRSVASERVDVPMDKELVLALKKAGAKHGASFFVTLFTAFGVLLTRLSNQRDHVVGVPVAGQSATGRELLVGHCANLLPVRLGVDPSQSFGDVLKSMRKTVLDAYDHQRFTLGAILPRLSVPRDPSRLPLVSVLFNLDTGMEGSGLVFDGLEVHFRANPRVSETFELFLNAFESKSGVVLECQYSTALWERATIVAWLEAYRSLLAGFVERADQPCSKLPLLSQGERRRLLVEANATQRAYPVDKTVLDLIAARAAATPEAIAVSDADEQLTYAGLVRAVRTASRTLRGRGIGRGDLVAVAVERSARMIPALLGILDTGAAYIPIDPQYPAERVAQMIAPAKLVVRDEDAADTGDKVALELADLFVNEGDASTDGWQPEARAAERAYVLFTSGSTGLPKGVEVTHRNLVNFVESMRAEPGMTAGDTLVAVVTLSFDIAGYEIYVPLAAGARIVVADRETAQDGRELAELMRSSRATVLQATPSTYRLLRAAGYEPRGLKALAGGELLPTDLAEWLVESGADLTNCYGPTETTIWSTIHRVREVRGTVPIGRPIANTSIYILDAELEPRPAGAWGEVFIGGDGVANGYLNRPDATAERFVPDPFSDKPGARLYRTGDVGRLRYDAVIEFLGRNDDQVKVRGHRIEIGEIEAVLSSHASLADSAVGVVRETGADARLVAFLVPKKGESVTATDVRKHLRKKLPDAMVPQVVVELATLPRTPNGKVDRRALAKLGAGERRREREITPPSTTSEKLVVELCARALGAGIPIGVSDNFFDVGGDSLKSMEVVVELERATGVRIAPRRLLLSSLGDIAKTLDAAPPGR
ncbi:MAG: amino acid adenylation domain-containing protein [Polyangiaceae bacterium]